MEQWKQIANVPDGYFVSNLGRVRIVKGLREWIKVGAKCNGYLTVSIDGVKHYVHRLVAEHWCDGDDNYECINHLNGIKTDNRAVNLEKTSYKKNNEHAVKNDLNRMKGEDHPNTEMTLERVLEIYRLKKEGKRLHEVHKIFNINYGTLKCIYNGSNWKYEYQKFFGESYKKQGGVDSGSKMWKSIPEEKVLKIYELKKMGKRIFEIAKELDLQFATVKNIFHGKNWKHLYKEHF